MIFVSYHLVKSRINQTLNMGVLVAGHCKRLWATIFCAKATGLRSECIPVLGGVCTPRMDSGHTHTHTHTRKIIWETGL